ncbi:MAG: Eco57I restriction-modification methylase domain-containing protein [Nitrospirae bacterium]|nr:Eco57I restriction-modification methylase domain-containing protein [Nitrospirota bacterium]
MNVSKEILELIERFDRNRESYRSGQYNETQLRREFLDPFFEALGWDVNNKQGYAEAYKDVIHEDSIRIGSATKAPDYCFRIGGTRKFFVEAKKPAVNLKDDVSPSFQLRRYAWSAKLPLSILTDFEEFAVYDCRIKPEKTDKASTARIFYLIDKEYAQRWNDIASIFSRESILKGSFDKYAETGKHKRGTAEVDATFLKEIESWRDMLARNIAMRNPDLSQRELNFAVQRTIDRIIFLRICEDRGVEEYGKLMTLMNGANVYRRLLEHFRYADEKYNSGLFHFQKEKDRHELPDELTPSLFIDDRHLKDIMKRLYYPESPYEFSVLPTEILGQVYEQFLGKVIRLTSGHRAIVEEKPEVRKAGGVYYTPAYIVDYIVKNTVGRILDNAPAFGTPSLVKRGTGGVTPKEASKIRILDPACGSGSFLLGAYQYLLDWHRDWYINDSPEKWAKGKNPALYQAQGGDWHLTTAEKKRILLNNIYGVDIDSQAVEVTKLSLLLKVLEGENNQSLERQLKFYHERALPDLGDNIKCGNSLIGPDFYQQQSMLDDEERYRINVFDWGKEFPEIMRSGGFDAVIGNPPYLYSAGQNYQQYFSNNYKLSQYQTDFYVYFIEKALCLGRKGGRVSFIVPDSWLNSEYFSKLRNYVLTNHHIDTITIFDYFVFKKAAIENTIFSIRISDKPSNILINYFISPTSFKTINKIDPAQAINNGIIDPRKSKASDSICIKMERNSVELEHYVYLNRGIHAYRTDGYGRTKFGSGPQTKKDKELQSYHANALLDHTYLRELKGKDIYRFTFQVTGIFLSYGPWLAEPRTPDFFYQPKVVLRKILGQKLHGALIEEPMALDQSLYILIPKNKDIDDLKFLLGVLLSSLGAWYLRTKYSIYDSLYPWYTKKQLATFPTKKVDNRIVQLVDQILSLNKQLASAKTDQEKTSFQRQIEATDKQIDKLVYELYGLTEEEIGIVEGS